MKAPTAKNGFPNIHGSDTICPFCGGSGGDIENVSTGHFHRSVSVTIGVRCMSGCYWELRISSERGELQAAECVLVDRDEALLEEMQSQGIADWAHTQGTLISG